MTNWPTAPIIIITKGQHWNTSLAGAVATHMYPGNPDGGYCVLTGPAAGACITPGAYKNETIDTWENATAVQDSTIERVCDAFQGSELTEEQDISIELLKAYTY